MAFLQICYFYSRTISLLLFTSWSGHSYHYFRIFYFIFPACLFSLFIFSISFYFNFFSCPLFHYILYITFTENLPTQSLPFQLDEEGNAIVVPPPVVVPKVESVGEKNKMNVDSADNKYAAQLGEMHENALHENALHENALHENAK